MKVWLVGGGTAGHVVPLLALAAALTDDTVTLVTDRTSAKNMPAEVSLPVKTVVSGKLRRYHGRSWLQRLLDVPTLLLNVRDVFAFGVGLLQSLWLVWRRRPDVVFINGGAIGVPVALACRSRHIPYIVHESDVVPGLANRIVAAHAHQLLFGFDPGEEVKKSFSAPSVVTGIQLRQVFDRLPVKKTAREQLDLPADEPIVLITGGSLGGTALIDIVLDELASLVDTAYIVHITGRKHYERVNRRRQELGKNRERYRVLAYVGDEMAAYMRAADVAVSRAGATTLAELAQTATATILVPNPRLAGDHQTKNARLFAHHRAAVVLEEAALRSQPGILTDTVRRLISSDTERQALSDAIHKLAVPDATERIIASIRQAGKGRGDS